MGVIQEAQKVGRVVVELLERAVLSLRTVDLAKIKPIDLHDGHFHGLRHTCATLLLSNNVNPKSVLEMLGHATIATYSHALPNMQSKAAKALEDALS